MAQITPRSLTLRDGSPARLRTPLPADAEPVIEHLGRSFADAPWVLRNPDEATFPLEEQRARLNAWLFDPRSLALLVEREHTATPAVIGMLVFGAGDRRKILHTGELGMGVDPAARGLGVGRALLVGLLDWAVTSPIEKVTLRVVPENAAARALYGSLGFQDEGLLRRHFRHDDGSYHDLACMAIYTQPGLAPEGFRTWGP